MATTSLPGPIVREVLNGENYVEWSVSIKNYLLAHDLWDVVEKDCPEEREGEEGGDVVEKDYPEGEGEGEGEEGRDVVEKDYPEGGGEGEEGGDVVEKDNPEGGGEGGEGEGGGGQTGKEERHPVWRRKNAAAFHAIMTSCGKKAVDLILNLSSAKKAWDELAVQYGSSDESSNGSSNEASDESSDGSSDESDDETYGYDPQYQRLYKAIQIGDWETTKKFLDAHSAEALTAKISFDGKTALHAAAAFMHTHIVEGLVELMSEDDLETKDAYDCTPLNQVCCVGITQMAKCMVNKNKKILTIPEPNENFLPVTKAVVREYKEMAGYLYSVTPLEVLLPEKGYYGATLLIQCLVVEYLDMALDLLKRCPQLATTQDDDGDTFVTQLAIMPSIFPSGWQHLFFQQWIYDWISIEATAMVNEFRIEVQNSNTRASDGNINLIRGVKDRAVVAFLDLLGINQIYETKLVHKQSQELLGIICDQISTLNSKQLKEKGLFRSILKAAEQGIPEFIAELIKANPELAFSKDEDVAGDFFFNAVRYRQNKVFSLIYGFIWKADTTNVHLENSRNNLLHMAGKLAPAAELNRISGAALKMQKELQWFKEVESIMPPSMKKLRNSDGMTARDLFTKEHEDLVKEGEKWMKETATSCTVVGALIVTIMFAAVFTVPGGNKQDTGYPMFLYQKSFMVFLISDAVSFFSSSTSVLMFLGILTSRYSEDDFLKSLPTKLIIGLSLLFISIATMMATFSAALFIMLEGKLWIVAPVVLLASVPIGLFVKLQFPLLVEIFISTFRSGIFDRNVKGCSHQSLVCIGSDHH